MYSVIFSKSFITLGPFTLSNLHPVLILENRSIVARTYMSYPFHRKLVRQNHFFSWIGEAQDVKGKN